MNGRNSENPPRSSIDYSFELHGSLSKPQSHPSLELPSGGGGVQGISETFKANPVSGTASLSIPLPIAKARGFTPNLSLTYDSGSGNTSCGMGWDIAVPTIRRTTNKQRPLYQDNDLSDTFSLAGYEDLVPVLAADSDEEVEKESATWKGEPYSVIRFQPRIITDNARIEFWKSIENQLSHWVIRHPDNSISVYGEREASRVFDSRNPSKIFTWAIDYQYNSHGHLVAYEYYRENLHGVDLSDSAEFHRKEQKCTAHYLARISYGNKRPFNTGPVPDYTGFHYHTVLDYRPNSALKFDKIIDAENRWPVRPDPVSSYQSGFEIRTYRRCHNVWLFHDFAELGPDPTIVQRLAFTYERSEQDYSFLNSVQTFGYTRLSEGSYESPITLPASSFFYENQNWNTQVKAATLDEHDNLSFVAPAGSALWVDLESEGLSGYLKSSRSSLLYHDNFGDGTFGPARQLRQIPSDVTSETPQFMSLEGNGNLVYISKILGGSGYYALNKGVYETPFVGLPQQVNENLQDRGVRHIDLSGDGKIDLLKDEGDAFLWYPSDGREGYKLPHRVGKLREDDVVSLLYSDAHEAIFQADMSGDGTTDIVRIRNGEIVYWPNLGYGRFGRKVTMAGAPNFGEADWFNPQYIKLADIDGSGPADLIYLGESSVSFWLNSSGNRWGEVNKLSNQFPFIDNRSDISIVDFLGRGTACIVWENPLGTPGAEGIKYIDLMDGIKPHLLVRYDNGMGLSTSLEYTPSTEYYLKDKERGQPWATRLHFPVHCLSKTTVTDAISKTKFVSAYSYHHGYYDRHEKEFRGFGRVDQRDSETFEDMTSTGPGANLSSASFHQPPMLTKTWYHTGASLQSATLLDAYEAEYFKADLLEPFRTPMTAFATDLSPAEWREAHRALKGTPLRVELYGEDSHIFSEVPFSVSETRVQVMRKQKKADNTYAVFQILPSTSLSCVFDRQVDDPKVSKTVALEFDDLGNTLLSASAHYGRQKDTSDIPASIRVLQDKPYYLFNQTSFTNDVIALHENGQDRIYRLRTAYKAQSWAIDDYGLSPQPFSNPSELFSLFVSAIEEWSSNPQTSSIDRLAASLTYLLGDDLQTVLPLGTQQSLGLIHHSEVLAFDIGSAVDIYGSKVTTDDLEAAGYGHPDGLGETESWWVTSSTAIYDAAAGQNFYQPIGTLDALGTPSYVRYDPYFLFVTTTLNVFEQETWAVIDYRTSSPRALRDKNENWSIVEYNALGMVTKSALMGKVQGVDRSGPTGIENCEGSNLEHPSAEIVYELNNYINTGQPVFAYSQIWEDHYFQNSARTKHQTKYEYSDGSGNVIMTKVQARPDSATPNVPRWIGNGRTVLNNKGNAIKQYEPYYSNTSEYETDAALVEQGHPTLSFYDVAGRPITALRPDYAFQKTVVSPWSSQVWDFNDLILVSNPEDDLDVGMYFHGLIPQDHISWYNQRQGGARGPLAQRAARDALPHAETFALSHTDSLGRTVYTEAMLGGGTIITTQTQLDIEGNVLSVTDDRDNNVMQYKYSALPPPGEDEEKKPLYQSGGDVGESWIFSDALGRPVSTWDSRGHVFRTDFDDLHRPTHSWLNTDDGTTTLLSSTEYGEQAPDAANHNLLGQAWRTFEQSGYNETIRLDFTGQVLEASRQFLLQYDGVINWNTAEAQDVLDPEVFYIESHHDALGRIIESKSPFNSDRAASIIRPTYHEGGGLDQMWVNIQGQAETLFVDRIDYDAKGQRERILYGNGVLTEYGYDPKLYHLTNLRTEDGAGRLLQDLNYSYDPVGNITDIIDNAQQSVYFSNTIIEPHNSYVYDPLYRLIEASGREHQGQAGGDASAKGWDRLPHINDGNAMQRYTQRFSYDGVGNILSLAHTAHDTRGQNWTRDYTYDGSNNQLMSTQLSGEIAVQSYAYNAHGSMIQMPHLAGLSWDHSEQLSRVDLQDGRSAHYMYSAGERVRKVIVQSPTKRTERLYFGGFEIYRELTNDEITLERESLHVTDDSSRIALVETQTIDNSATLVAPSPIIRYQLGNHLGSASLELDEGGSIISYEEYHPYGTTSYHAGTSRTDVPAKRYRYTGKERDEETGFSYHGARYYVASLARWSAADPIKINGGINVYEYAASNPIILSDPSGNAPVSNHDDTLLNDRLDTKPEPYLVLPIEQKMQQLPLDTFVSASYHPSYMHPGDTRGAWSTWVQLEYHDGRTMDFNLKDIDGAISQDITAELLNPTLGPSSIMFPRKINQSTAPRLWKIKETIFRAIEDDFTDFVAHDAAPVILTIATLGVIPIAPMSGGRGRPPNFKTRSGSRTDMPDPPPARTDTPDLPPVRGGVPPRTPINPLPGTQGRVNVGGAGEAAGYTNLNPNLTSARSGIPNHVYGMAEDMGEIFNPGSVTEMIANRLPPNFINLDQWAAGAHVAMRPGGRFTINMHGSHQANINAATAFRNAGFRNVQVQHGVIVTGIR